MTVAMLADADPLRYLAEVKKPAVLHMCLLGWLQSISILPTRTCSPRFAQGFCPSVWPIVPHLQTNSVLSLRQLWSAR